MDSFQVQFHQCRIVFIVMKTLLLSLANDSNSMSFECLLQLLMTFKCQEYLKESVNRSINLHEKQIQGPSPKIQTYFSNVISFTKLFGYTSRGRVRALLQGSYIICFNNILLSLKLLKISTVSEFDGLSENVALICYVMSR